MFTSKNGFRALRLGVMLALPLAGASCASDDYRRGLGITDEAGDAIAHNTTLQMVDPWPMGVDDTDLEVPADRGDDNTDPLKPAEKTDG